VTSPLKPGELDTCVSAQAPDPTIIKPFLPWASI